MRIIINLLKYLFAVLCVYSQAHARATNQSGFINETLYDASGNVLTMTPTGGYPANVASVEWYVTDTKGNRVVIQKLP